jgi:SAM-dependent methyltransferase
VTGAERPTAAAGYARRLEQLEGARWKQLLDVQRPYRWNVRRLCPGFTLDVGCGIGRNLGHLRGNGVGVDHNPAAVATARERGLTAFTTDEFDGSAYDVPGRFDHLLLAHVVEHCTEDEAVALVARYVGDVRPGGTVVVITPQEAGQRTDATHVTFCDHDVAARILARAGVRVEASGAARRSFPFPRIVGRVFPYNEFVTTAVVAAGDADRPTP